MKSSQSLREKMEDPSNQLDTAEKQKKFVEEFEAFTLQGQFDKWKKC